ncbi:MAG: anti-sigma regulatory factor [Phycisphaerales bacterium]|nr:MAG: anti-sigma regulatory factor [Phycisphaerales bacterium]
MHSEVRDTLSIVTEEDSVRVRQVTREKAVEAGFNLVAQTKFVTAASELARNTLKWGGGGTVRFEAVDASRGRGLRLVFEDHGPGIPDVELALTDGFSTSSGLGMGLGGAKRLVDEFDIESRVGVGTKVSITMWR